MSNYFEGMTTDGVEIQEDRMGGFSLFDTDAYIAKVKLAYMTKTKSGESAVAFTFDINGQEFRPPFPFTLTKDGKNVVINQQTKKKEFTIGFNQANAIALMATGSELVQQPIEERTFNIYDFDEKKELPKSVPTLVNLLGKEVGLAIVHRVSNKQVQQGNAYVDTNEKREQNHIEHIFHPESKGTLSEYDKKQKTPSYEFEFINKWLEKNKGVVQNRFKEVAGGASAGRPNNNAVNGGGTATASATSSLFNK